MSNELQFAHDEHSQDKCYATMRRMLNNKFVWLTQSRYEPQQVSCENCAPVMHFVGALANFFLCLCLCLRLFLFLSPARRLAVSSSRPLRRCSISPTHLHGFVRRPLAAARIKRRLAKSSAPFRTLICILELQVYANCRAWGRSRTLSVAASRPNRPRQVFGRSPLCRAGRCPTRCAGPSLGPDISTDSRWQRHDVIGSRDEFKTRRRNRYIWVHFRWRTCLAASRMRASLTTSYVVFVESKLT